DASSVANVLESGTGIAIEGDETLTISNTGVLSFNGQTGNVSYDATGVLSLNGETGHVTLDAGELGLAKETFKSIVIPGSNTITASAADDTLTFIPGAGVVLESDADNKSITISSTLASSA